MPRRKARILVVDDSRPAVTLVQGALKRGGYDVHAAYDGKDGLAQAREFRPDLIILDIMMPGMNGYEVCIRLEQDPDTAKIAVLIPTARGGVGEAPGEVGTYAQKVRDRWLGFEVGAADYLTKPIKGKDLAKRVKALLWTGGGAF